MSTRRKYHINCDCSSYIWERYPPRGQFMRCRHCGRTIGPLDFSQVRDGKPAKKRKVS